MIGNIISAGASILGGFMNRASHKDAQAQTAYFADKNMRMQEEFAQNGIRWRVNDARKAGIHPLYALGASVPSYTPSSVSFAGDSSLGNSFAQAGQDIGRAINSTRTASERVDAFAKSMQAIQLENAGLDTEIKRAQLAAMIAKNRDNATPPGPGGDVRSLQIFEGENPVTTPKSEVQQQKVSDEYGDEGLASIPGQVRIFRDYLRSQGIELPRSTDGYNEAIKNWLLSEWQKFNPTLTRDGIARRFLDSLPNFGGR